jgi:hypothetical protein
VTTPSAFDSLPKRKAIFQVVANFTPFHGIFADEYEINGT